MGRDTSKVSNRGRGTTTAIMEEGETNWAHDQKWACSSLSSSDKFSSLYDKVLEGSAEWDQKNVESLVSSQSLQRSTAQPAVAKPRSKIFFPHVMTRGSVVGNKVYCKTSINNCFTWRPRCSNSLCASSSVLLTNFYLERSSDIQSGIAKSAEEAPSSDPEEENEKPEEQPRPRSTQRCRTLLLTVAGAAGMQLLFPSIRLPLLEVLLISHQKLPTRRRRSPLFSDRGGGWWRLPLNLALAISRPFYGSALRRSLTAVLFLVQFRIRDKSDQRSARYMPDLYSVPSLEKPTPVDTDLNVPSEISDNSSDTEAAETLSWESNSSATCSEDGDNCLQAEEEDLTKMENDSSHEFPPSRRAPQDVISDDGLSSTGETCEQDVISDDGLSSSGDSVDDRDVISDGENSSITSSCLKESDDYNLGHISDNTSTEATEQSVSQAYHTAFSQPYDESPDESSPTGTTSSSVFTSENCSSSDVSTSSLGSEPYSVLFTSRENSDETSSSESSDITTSSSGDQDIVVTTEEDSEGNAYSGLLSLEENSDETNSSSNITRISSGDQDIVVAREEDSEETHSTLTMSSGSALSSLWVGGETDSVPTWEDTHENHHSSSNVSTLPAAGSDPDSVVTIEENLAEYRCISDTSTTSGVIYLNNIFSTEEEDVEETYSTLHTSTSSAGMDSDFQSPLDSVVTTEDDLAESRCISDTSTTSGVIDLNKTSPEEEEDVEETYLHTSTSSAGIDPNSVIIPKEDTGEAYSTVNVFPSLAGSDPDSAVTIEENLAESRCISDTSTTSGIIDLNNIFPAEEDVERTYSTLHASTSSAGIDLDSVITPEVNTEEAHSTLNAFSSLTGSDPDWVRASLAEDSAGIVEKQSRLLSQQRDGESTPQSADTFRADVVDEAEQNVPSKATAGTTSCFPGEQPPPPQTFDDAVVENSVAAVSSLDDQVSIFPFSEEFQFHDDIPPSPCETSRSSPSSPGRLLALFVSADGTQSTPGSIKSLQHMSPRADLTALMPEEYGCVPADGTWEIQVDRDELEVVWTPFRKRPVLQSDREEDSSEFSDESTADDTDSCKSAHGSQTGRDDDEGDDDDLSHGDRKTRMMMAIVQNDAISVQDLKLQHDRVQTASNKNFGVDVSSVNRLSRVNSVSSRRLDEDDDASDERECLPPSTTGRTVRMTIDNADDFEFQSSLRLRDGEAAANACEAQGNKVVRSTTPQVKLSIPLHGEKLFGLRRVIPEHSDRSDSPEEAASTFENSFAPRPFLHSRKCPAAELLQSEDDCSVGAVTTADSENLSSLRVVVDSASEEFDRVRVPVVVARVHEEETVQSHIKRNKSLAVSVSSSSFVTAFGDDADTPSSDTPSESTSVWRDSRGESSDASSTSTSSSRLFTDHPTCLHLRKVRHSHGDQVYLKVPELLSEPWRNLVYWHGRCREGRPTLVVLLGKAVIQLSAPELKHFITVTISHAEYAELNFFKGAVKQLNILMDLDGLGFMRLPPMHVLQSIGTILNRDYAGRGGWIFLVNAPVMLGLVISAMQRVILRPSYTKGAVIDKGFLEGKERIVTLGGRYKATLLKHFDEGMLPSTLGGSCTSCSTDTSQCRLGFDSLPR